MDLRDLYQDIIVDHNRSPRNFREPERFDRKADGFNPLCGDKLKIYLCMDGDQISDVSFQGSGCAISVASASLMTEAVKGLNEADARTLFEEVHEALTGDDSTVDLDKLGKLAAILGVRAFPSRVKCASLCWHTLTAALDQKDAAVSTE